MRSKVYSFNIVIFLWSILLLAIVLSGCSQLTSDKETASDKESSSGERQKVSIALDSGVFSLPFRLAGDKGLFKKYGVDAEFATYSFGIDTLNTVITNQADIGIAMDYAALTRVGKGDLKIVSRFAIPNSNRRQLLVKGNINKPEDLKGKRVGVQSGTVVEYIWARYLEKYNIKKTDITIEPLTSTAEIYTAFEKGEIDGAWFDGPFLDKAKNVAGAKFLADLNNIDFIMRGYVVASGDFVQKNPETISKILKALNEANPYIKEHPDEAADLAFKELKLPADKVQEEVKRDWVFDITFNQDDIKHLQDILEWTQKNGLIKEKFNINDKIAVAPLEQALPDKTN